MLQRARRSLGHWLRHWPRRKIIAWGAGSLALLLIGVTATGYEILHHFNANIEQDDISALLGAQPVNTHPQAENIMVIGSDSRDGLSAAYGSGLVTDQSDTLMIIHIPADRKWAEVMSIPRDSWVNIPACEMGNGQVSSPTQFKINEAFAIGNLDGNHTSLGVACTVKTVEQDTGIYINHFIVINFTGFENMVAALGGVYECNPTPINDPNSDLHLSAGNHLLTPAEALRYVRARYTLGDVPASSSLFGASTTTSASKPTSKPTSKSASTSTAGHTLSTSPSPSASPSGSPLTIPARTANQSICAG